MDYWVPSSKVLLITGPSVEPITRAEVKESQRITDCVLDDVLDRYIEAAREYAEDRTRIAMIDQTWELVMYEFPVLHECISLCKNPTSITSIKYYDLNNVEQTWDSNNYQLDLYSNPPKIRLAADVDEWPSTYDRWDGVKIQFVAGFGASGDDVPTRLKQAMHLTVGHWTKHSPQVELGVPTSLMVPHSVNQLLDSYRTPVA